MLFFNSLPRHSLEHISVCGSPLLLFLLFLHALIHQIYKLSEAYLLRVSTLGEDVDKWFFVSKVSFIVVILTHHLRTRPPEGTPEVLVVVCAKNLRRKLL